MPLEFLHDFTFHVYYVDAVKLLYDSVIGSARRKSVKDMRAVELLMEEHRVIERALTLLELAAAKMERGECVSKEVLRELLNFFRVFADKCHHGKEEDALFPLLEARGVPREGGPIGVMLYEHQLGRGYIKAMAESLDAIEKDSEAKTKFTENALNYLSLLREHIFKEDNILFRIALEVLDEKDNENLITKFENIEETKVGAGVHEQMIDKLDEIEKLLKTS
jgi:hemerythrin-like domain-containing protein